LLYAGIVPKIVIYIRTIKMEGISEIKKPVEVSAYKDPANFV
jgi:hypothetical protein